MEIRIDSGSYASSFLQKFNKLRQDRKACDFAIKVDGDTYDVHRNVLMISSEYFRAMLEHDTAENRLGYVVMKDVNPVAVQKCVDFIYTGKAFVESDGIKDLIHVAYLMQLEVLCEGIGELLTEKINVESFYATKVFSETYNCKGLGDVCKQYAQKNFRALAALDEFTTLEEEYILALIGSTQTNAAEIEKYKAFKKWIDFDNLNREKLFPAMLKTIDTVKLPSKFRRFIVENEPMVYKSAECLQALLCSFFETAEIVSKDFDVGNYNSILVYNRNSDSIDAYNVELGVCEQIRPIGSEVETRTFSIIELDRSVFALRSDRKVFRLQYLDDSTKWTEMASMLQQHGNYPPVVVQRNYIWVAGNKDTGDNSTERYDIDADEWSEVTVTGQFTKRKDFAMCASIDSMYFIGGYTVQHNRRNLGGIYRTVTATLCLYNAERFTVENCSIQPVEDMTTARYSPAVAYRNGRIYVVGGRTEANYLSVAEVYDEAADSWTTIANLPAAPCPVCAIFVMDSLFVLGSSQIFKYDDKNDSWTEKEGNDGLSIAPESGCSPIAF